MHADDPERPALVARPRFPKPGPPAATATADLAVPADRVWALVTDVRNHVRWIPATRIDAPATTLAVGDTFTAVTGPRATRGGAGLTDRMTLERLDPPSATRPGVAVYRKLGPVLLGQATVQVRPTGPASCTLIWTEAVHLRGLPRRLTALLLRPMAAGMLHHALRRVRAELG